MAAAPSARQPGTPADPFARGPSSRGAQEVRVVAVIVDVRIRRVTIPLAHAARWSGGTRRAVPLLMVEVEADDGRVGLGEAVGPSLPLIETALRDEFVPLIAGSPVDEWPASLDRLLEYGAHWPRVAAHAVAGLEMALLDLTGQSAGVAAGSLLGRFRREPVRFAGYLFIDEPEANAAEARALVAAGYDEIKIKVGRDTDLDVRRLRAIREAVGPAVTLKVDANMGWDRTAARRAIAALAPFRLAYVEQPLRDDDHAGLRELRQAGVVPIAVDESIRSFGDALRLVEAAACDVFVVYTSEAGGLREAGHIARLAEEAGLTCCLGSWGESGIGMAAATAFLSGQRAFPYANDTHYQLLAGDIVRERFTFVKGRASAPLGPSGWGCTIDPEGLGRYGTAPPRERVFVDEPDVDDPGRKGGA